jgi:hypothetical protein
MGKKHSIFIVLLLTLGIILIAGCITQTNRGNGIKPFPASATCSQQSNSEPFIIINPIAPHTVGEIFEINGTTNLDIDKKLNISVDEDRRNTAVGPYDIPDWNYTYTDSRGYVTMNGGDCGINSWSYRVNLTEFHGQTLYGVNVESEQNRTIINYSFFFVRRGE